MSAYSEKLKDPRWQKKRLQILERDGWACQSCFDTETTLHVHHTYYERGCDPWDYPDDCFVVLCAICHEYETNERPKAEARLLDILKRHKFLAGDVNRIAVGFERLKLLQHPEIIASAIEFGLGDVAIQNIILEGMFESNDIKAKEKQNGVD